MELAMLTTEEASQQFKIQWIDRDFKILLMSKEKGLHLLIQIGVLSILPILLLLSNRSMLLQCTRDLNLIQVVEVEIMEILHSQ